MPAARVELIEAQDWYERAAPGLGRRFREEVAFQVDRIAAHPKRFPEIMADMRRARLRRFPYGLFFRQLEDAIYAVACFHASRDPLVWQSRMGRPDRALIAANHSLIEKQVLEMAAAAVGEVDGASVTAMFLQQRVVAAVAANRRRHVLGKVRRYHHRAQRDSKKPR